MASKTDLDKVMDLRKQLQTASTSNDTAQIRTALLRLRQEVRPTEELIRESKIGLAVGKLRSNANKEVAELAKDIVKKWKQDVAPTRATPPVKVESKPSPAPVPSPEASRAPIASPSTSKALSPPANGTAKPPAPGRKDSTPSATGGPPRTAKGDGMTFDVFLDKTRDKCMELIYDALCSDSSAPSDVIFERARAIEEGTYAGNGHQCSAAYKSKMRSLYLNLKDKANPALRASLVAGDLAADKLWSMSPQELASEERRKHDREIKDANLFESLGAAAQASETDMFMCGRCKQRKCTYYQLQTRSADEPMTTFVTCVNCDNRWKF